MTISIIIPTINRDESLLNLLNNLIEQSVKDFEVIIIDQNQGDRSIFLNEIKKFKFANYYFQQEPSASMARNLGINESRAPIILFLDDDCKLISPKFIQFHLMHYDDKELNGVIGSSIDIGFNSGLVLRKRFWSSIHPKMDWFFFPKNFIGSTFLAVGRSNNLSVRKSIALKVNGMDENFYKGAHREEGDFCLRVYDKYGSFLYEPKALVHHLALSIGGIRSWNTKGKVKPIHHLVGAIYFDLKHARSWYGFFFSIQTLRYSIFNKYSFSSIRLLILSVISYFRALYLAIGLYFSGAKYLNSKK